jgi:hypothetical protein
VKLSSFAGVQEFDLSSLQAERRSQGICISSELAPPIPLDIDCLFG